MARRNGKRTTRRIAGVVATTIDFRTWTWSIGTTLYRWCKLGHLEIVGKKECARINYWHKLEAAVAWTVGYAEGYRHHRWGHTYQVQ